MTKKQKILSRINKNGLGLEIGAGYNPIARKSEGYQVRTLDHLSREDLIAKYQAQRVDVSHIETVDYIWKGEPYRTLVGESTIFDWIIASHVIEHTPDLIGFLNNCAGVLNDNGSLVLAIPDKRYCFDHFRAPSSLAQVLDANAAGLTRPSPGMIADFLVNCAAKNGAELWDPYLLGKLSLRYTPERLLEEMAKAVRSDTYYDVHTWSFTPNSFRLLIHDLNVLGAISLQEDEFIPSFGSEFIVVLKKEGCPKSVSRLRLAKRALEDLQPSLLRRLLTQAISLASMPARFVWHRIR